MIRKVVVPLDGSPSAEAVLPLVASIASATKADIVLVTAVTPVAVWDEEHVAVKWQAEEDNATDYLQAKQGELAGSGLSVQSRVIFGAAADVILRCTADEQADLIAMSTHGRSGLARWVLGSVATKVLHASPTPVLVIRPSADGGSEPRTIAKVLVPLDGSELSASALPFAADLAKSLDASIVLFQAVLEPVITYPGSEAILHSSVLEGIVSAARKSLAATVDDLTAQGLKAGVIVNVGNATDGIVWAAERDGADLIVMSTHGRSGLGRMVIGSVADAVVRRTSLPVVLVRPNTNESG